MQNLPHIHWRANSRFIDFLETLRDPVNIDSLFLLDIFADDVGELDAVAQLQTLEFVRSIFNNPTRRCPSYGIVMHQNRIVFLEIFYQLSLLIIVTIDYRPSFVRLQRIKGVVGYCWLGEGGILPDKSLEIGSARVETRPVVQIEIAVIRKKVVFICGPLESWPLLLSQDSLIIFVHCAIFELHFSSNLFISYNFKGIFKKLVTKISELIWKILACRDQNMICFKLAGIIEETLGESKFIPDNLPVAALEFWFNNFSLQVHLVHVKFARCTIIIIKYVCEDTRTCKLKSVFYKLWLPQKFKLLVVFSIIPLLRAHSWKEYGF